MEDVINIYWNIWVWKIILNKIYQNYFMEEWDAEQCNFSCVDVHKDWWRSQLEQEYVAASKLMKSRGCV
jgi:hypothetical protein